MAEAFCRGQDLGDEPVVICAWCDPDQVQARALRAQGKRVSHTICPAHAVQQLARARELNREKSLPSFPPCPSVNSHERH